MTSSTWRREATKSEAAVTKAGAKLSWQPAFRARRPEIVEGFVMPGYAGRYYMWPEELSLLGKYVDLSEGDYLEIGSMCGIIAMSFAQKFPERQFVCVDYFQPGWGTIAGDRDSFFQNLRNLNLKNVTLIEGDSRVEVPKLTRSFGIAFIDGNHAYDYVLQDAVNCHRVLKEGGYLLFHDYECVEDTTRAVHDFIRQTDCCLVEVASSVAVVCKPAVPASAVHKPQMQREIEDSMEGLEHTIKTLEYDLGLTIDELRAHRAHAAELENSAGWRAFNKLRVWRNRIAPEGTWRHKLYKLVFQSWFTGRESTQPASEAGGMRR